MVPAHSIKVSRVSMYSGSRCVMSFFAYGAFTLSGWLSQNHSAKFHESLLRSEPRDARIPVWALPVSLAATSGIDVSFSSSGYLDVSVHRVPLHTLLRHTCLYSVYGYMESVHVGFPIQRSVDQGIFAPPHGFSQLITSFFGSQCQGIHPALFLA